MRNRSLLFVLLGGAIVWLVLLGAYLLQFARLGFSDQQGVWGQFGDYLGGILNPVFGFAGFLILVVTLLQQREQINDQQEMSAQQTFETTFFQLLHRFSEVVGDLRYEYSLRSMTMFPTQAKPSMFIPLGVGSNAGLEVTVTKAEGRVAIRAMFEHGFKPVFKKVAAGEGITHRQRCVTANRMFYRETEHELGIFFRTFYHVMKFIDTSAFNFATKVRYANIARAQLSSYELSMILYNALWGEGKAGMKPLIEKYGLLKHIKESHVLDPADIQAGNLFPETAFAKFTRRLELFGGIEPQISYD